MPLSLKKISGSDFKILRQLANSLPTACRLLAHPPREVAENLVSKLHQALHRFSTLFNGPDSFVPGLYYPYDSNKIGFIWTGIF